jgi:hypothetical protein
MRPNNLCSASCLVSFRTNETDDSLLGELVLHQETHDDIIITTAVLGK